jgi:hypothetical protein
MLRDMDSVLLGRVMRWPHTSDLQPAQHSGWFTLATAVPHDAGELLDNPPPGFDEAVAISKVRWLAPKFGWL